MAEQLSHSGGDQVYVGHADYGLRTVTTRRAFLIIREPFFLDKVGGKETYWNLKLRPFSARG